MQEGRTSPASLPVDDEEDVDGDLVLRDVVSAGVSEAVSHAAEFIR